MSVKIADTTSPDSSHDVEFSLRRKRRWRLPVAIAAVVAIAAAVIGVTTLSGGSNSSAVPGSHFGNVLSVAYEADSGSEKGFLDYLNTSIAPKYGLTIKPVGIEDGNQLDQATANGQLAANIYQHEEWLAEVVAKTGWKLTAVAPVFQWAYSVYSSKYDSLSQIPDGGTIAILNDPANTAQALWLLARAHEITFKSGVNPWQATVDDIASNPHDYKFTFIDYGSGPRVLNEVAAVIAYNFQFISAGVTQKDKIYAPPAPPQFASRLVVGTNYQQDPQILKLEKVFTDPRVQKYLKSTSNPALKDQISPVSKG